MVQWVLCTPQQFDRRRFPIPGDTKRSVDVREVDTCVSYEEEDTYMRRRIHT